VDCTGIWIPRGVGVVVWYGWKRFEGGCKVEGREGSSLDLFRCETLACKTADAEEGESSIGMGKGIILSVAGN